ncbi:MAG: PhnD/SsuA/transferrin family substrate-binding protein, partial [Thiohalomonadales bacterium]
MRIYSNNFNQVFVLAYFLPAIVFLMLLNIGDSRAAIANNTKTTKIVNIGVLALRGAEKTLAAWNPTAQYLESAIQGYTFNIIPLDNDSIASEVEKGSIDFILSNPASYASLEAQHGISRIVTLRNRRLYGAYTKFGALIFTRADRQDIKNLADIKGKRFMAVHPNAFGGWWMALKTFRDHDIDPAEDFAELIFNGFPQDNIVLAVRDGRVDAGTVRTDLIERMAQSGVININNFRILNPQQAENFPFAHSTELYPEWAFATTKHTSEALAQRVAIALLSLPTQHAAARASKSAGWTVPMDYQSVHALMKELKVGPYENTGKFGVKDVFIKYRFWFLAIVFVIVTMSGIIFYVFFLNKKISHTAKKLEIEVGERNQAELLSQKHSRRLRAIYEIATMSGDVNYQAQFREILNIGCKFLHTEFACVNEVDSSKQTNSIVEFLAPAESWLKQGYCVPLENTFCDAVIKQESIIVINDAEDSQWKSSIAYQLSGFRSYIAAPIFVNGKIFGSINFSSKSPRVEAYSKADEQFVELMGNFTSAALGRQIAQDKINEAKTHAIMANKAKSEFLANMSHEIRTPMNAILGYAQILSRDETISDSQRHAIKTINNSGTHLLDLINEVLDISKIESGRMTLTKSNFDLIATLNDISFMFAYRCKEKQITWDMHMFSGDELFVYADSGKIRQILINLLGNAIKFTIKGRVSLHCKQVEPNCYQFDIVDSGPGIPDDERAELFTPFSQTKSGIDHGGTGLGLAIAKKQLELMGGKLELLPDDGKGAHFRMLLSLPAGDVTAVKPTMLTHQSYRLEMSKPLHALVVDDVEHNRNILAEQLKTYGFFVSMASDGIEAVEKANNVITDIIFMDYRMPRMNGIVAMQKIRKNKSNNIKIAMVSASAYEHEVEKFSQCGADI